MTALTANRNYVYPIASDRPRDTALHVAQMVSSLEADLLYLDSEFKRFERYPLCIIETSTPSVLPFNGADQSLTFDTVVEDTWGTMANLAEHPQLISLPADVPGTYLVGASFWGGVTSGTNNEVDIGTYGWTDTMTLPGPDTNAGCSSVGFALTPDPGYEPPKPVTIDIHVFWLPGIGVEGPLTINKARLWAMWVRDL